MPRQGFDFGIYSNTNKVSLTGKKSGKRKNFKLSTKKVEWNASAGRATDNFKTTSKCRKCPRRLTWKDGTYDFDHKNDNSSDNSQKNCYLVCKVCHGRVTKIGKRKVRTMLGVRYQTIKKKVGYKKPKKKPLKKKSKPKERKPKSIFDIASSYDKKGSGLF